MRLVHMADLHIGFRQFERDTKGGTSGIVSAGVELGKNLREADVEGSCRTAFSKTIELAPDGVIIGGDVFHSFRPSNGAIAFAISEFQRLLQGLRGAPVIVAAGNHDLPRSRETSTIMCVLREIGVHVAEWEARRFEFSDRGLAVLAVPESMIQRPALAPDPRYTYNVLCLHGEVHGMPRVKGDRGDVEVSTEELNAPAFDYVGLGHYHVCHEIAPNCWYSGSIDYTSTNPWGEKQDERKFGLTGKSFIERHLDTGAHTIHPIPLSRDHIDATLSAHGMSVAELNVAIAEKLDDMHPDMAIARLIITDCPRNLWREVDQKIIKPFKLRALNLQVVAKAPEVVTVGSPRIGTYRRPPLEDQLETLLKNRYPEGSDLSLDAISKLGRSYLARAQQITTGDDPELVPKLEASIAAGAA